MLEVIIPVFDGETLTETFTDSLFRNLDTVRNSALMVIGNPHVPENFRRLLTSEKTHFFETNINPGFIQTANLGAVFCEKPYFMILRSSQKITSRYLESILSNTPVEKNFLAVTPGTRYNSFLSCGSLFNRKFFLKLGGFNRKFSPFAGENIELSLKAAERGISIINSEKSAGLISGHQYPESSSMNKTDLSYVLEKNRIILQIITSKKKFLTLSRNTRKALFNSFSSPEKTLAFINALRTLEF